MKRFFYKALDKDGGMQESFSSSTTNFEENIVRDWLMNLGYKVEITLEEEEKKK